MPTSSVAGFSLRAGTGGGAEAPLGDSQVPWQAAVGNRVRLVSFARTGRRRSVAGFARSMGEVAIDSLAAPPEYIRLFFAMSSTIHSLLIRLSRGTASGLEPVVTLLDTVYPAADILQ